MHQTLLICGVAISALAGCITNAGPFSEGENADYGITNVSPRELEEVRVEGANGKSYAGQLGQPAYHPLPGKPRVMPSFGGNRFMSDTGHKIPEEVWISWREMPSPGGKPYTGELKGPYKVLIRSRIPEDVLKLSRRDGFVIQVGLTSGVLPIVFQWRLVDERKGSDFQGRVTPIAQGGDSFQ